MKILKTIAIAVLVLTLIPFVGQAKEGRKLPMGAYIKSAKIDILSGDLERYTSAIAMLDSLFMYYGPTAEAIQLRGSIEVDYIDKAESMDEKKEHVATLMAYVDTLRICCDKNNKEVKKKYKKDCDELLEKNDSLIVKYWREFYNTGINLMNNEVVSIQTDIQNETDSAIIVEFQKNLQSKVDSAVASFEICLELDPAKEEPYIGLGALHEKIGDFQSAIDWLVKGVEVSENKARLLQTISYDYIQMNDYAGAIPYMRKYIELAPDDIMTMTNLAICYNSQKMYDSSIAVNKRILSIDSANVDALASVGNYFRQQSQNAQDSVRTYSDAKDETNVEVWVQERETAIDSFLVYYKKIIEIDPNNEQVQFLYATYNYFRSNWDIAIKAFSAAAGINPNEKDYWRYLGDAYIQTKEFAKSAEAYEKAVAIDAKDIKIWEQLVNLYTELGKPKDKARAQKQVKALE